MTPPPARGRARLPLWLSLYLVEFVAAWLIAAPWIEPLAGVARNHPDGDAALFAPGLELLVDVAMRSGELLSALRRVSLFTLATWFVLGIFLDGVALAGLSPEADESEFDPARAVGRATAAFTSLSLVTALGFVVTALVATIGAFAVVAGAGHWEHDPPKAFVAVLFLAAPFVLGALVVHATIDLCRASIVRHGHPATAALRTVLGAPREPLRLFALALPRWVAGLGGGARRAPGGPPPDLVIAVFLAHQAIAFGRVGLRLSVLSRALTRSDAALAVSRAAAHAQQ
jgi:hypothetical protein